MAKIHEIKTVEYVLHNLTKVEVEVILKCLQGEDLTSDENTIRDELVMTIEALPL